MSVSVRRAGPADVGFLVALVTHEDVAPFLSTSRPGSEAELLPEIERSMAEPDAFHRLQLEVYAFNERALAHAEHCGFTREGVRRKAYWRNEEWVDGVLFGLVAEDLDGS